METFRKVVLPILRIVVWAVIAFALIRIAFPPNTPSAQPGDEPTFNPVNPTVQVATGTVTNTVTLDGTIVTVAATPVRITLAGTVSRVFVQQGQWVDAGAKLFEVIQRVEQTPLVNQASGEVTNRPPKTTKATMTAPVAGTLVSFTLLKDQIVAVGDVGARVAAGTLQINATLTPEQQFRLLAVPTTATATVPGGPAPFECIDVQLVSASATAGADAAGVAGSSPGANTAGNQIVCTIPAGVKVFNGLPARLEITSGQAADVAVVPVTAVQGRVQNGKVWKVSADGTQTVTSVGLGLTDGAMIEVTSGLSAGDQILQFAPTTEIPLPGAPAGPGGTAPSQAVSAG